MSINLNKINYKLLPLSSFILFFFSLFIPLNLSATTLDATWSSVDSAGSGAWFISNISADGMRMVAIRGTHIYTSSDGGINWSDVANSLNAITTSSFDTSSGHSLMIGTVRRILFIPGPAAPDRMKYSTDYGVTWSDINSSDAKWWKGTTISSDGQKIAVTADGGGSLTGNYTDYITYSTDGGSTWATSTSSGQKRWGPITSSSDGSIVVAGEQSGSLFISSDYGSTWGQLNNSASTTWISLAASADGSRLFGAANNGYVYTSSDTGQNWATSTSLGSSSWKSISASSDGSRILLLDSDTVYVSRDYGDTWTEQTIFGSGKVFHSGGLSSDGLRAIIGSGDYIYVGNFDVTPPIISDEGPSGAFSSNTTSVSLELTTDESATCRWSLNSGTSYSSMANTFETTGGTSHSTSVSVVKGTAYTYYVRCSDASDNPTTSDAVISFSVDNPSSSGSRSSKTIKETVQNNLDILKTNFPVQNSNNGNKIVFDSNLRQGQGASPTIKNLQIFLNNHGFTLATQGPGSPGQETNFFGPLTFQALKKFQITNNLPATGFFGPLTRGVINNLK